MEEIRQAAHNGSIDVGASLSTPQKESNLNLRRKTLYWNRASLVLFLIPWNLDLLRGLLNQSTAIRLNSATRRIIFMLVFAQGGALNILFSITMANWLTMPPHKTPIESFDDVAERNLQIQVPEPDIAEIKFYCGEIFWNQHKRLFHIVKSVDEFQENIRKMDKRYGYLINTLNWPIIEQRQKYFKHPLFRLSESLYYTKGSLLSLPISENSMYKDLLSLFSLRSREAGLLDYWYKRTFYTMVSIGRFNLTDLSKNYKHEVLTLKEFEWVWITYIFVTLLQEHTALPQLKHARCSIATNISYVRIEICQRLPVATVSVKANVYVRIGDRQSAVDNPRCGVPNSEPAKAGYLPIGRSNSGGGGGGDL
ncbi:PREDICTED: uncharacterized protein LOC108975330 [Bactrocera latifrons]|uniref:uncharacterized protein LOC108975330 n=1 Tax=Bactrocera latifrons TaxID=174628 RepID=UPI0008DD97F0|nr:PREDICTED: uncharacterized protein LOC108975330 [Bactrocera latifrons]